VSGHDRSLASDLFADAGGVETTTPAMFTAGVDQVWRPRSLELPEANPLSNLLSGRLPAFQLQRI